MNNDIPRATGPNNNVHPLLADLTEVVLTEDEREAVQRLRLRRNSFGAPNPPSPREVMDFVVDRRNNPEIYR